MRPTIGHPYHRAPKIDLLPLVASLVDFSRPRRFRCCCFWLLMSYRGVHHVFLIYLLTEEDDGHQTRVKRKLVCSDILLLFTGDSCMLTLVCRVFGAGDGSRLPGPTPDVDVSTRSAYVPFSPTPPPPPPPSPSLTAAPHSTRPIVGKITFCNMQNILYPEIEDVCVPDFLIDVGLFYFSILFYGTDVVNGTETCCIHA